MALQNINLETTSQSGKVPFHGKRLFCQSSWEGLRKVFQIELETTFLKVKGKKRHIFKSGELKTQFNPRHKRFIIYS